MSSARISRRIDRKNLVRELAHNKVDALELLREALSNAKDHGAQNLWLRSVRRNPPEQAIDIYLLNDGEGMSAAQKEAFWGVSASFKPENQNNIGYKGHGTKLYFSARRLSVATRQEGDPEWRLSTLEDPLHSDVDAVEESRLEEGHPLAKELRAVGLWPKHGVAILIENCSFRDAARFTNRRTVESYCDWFTVVGDVRAGVFKTRAEFHETIAARRDLGTLRSHECEIRLLSVLLRINGEQAYTPLGFGPKDTDSRLLAAWNEDVSRWKREMPGMAAFGHRFADHHESQQGARRIRDDLTALCLTDAATFFDDTPYSLVLRVEGRRRQLQTYQEGSRQPVGGEYDFNDRFGLWLCKDFVPIVRRNDLLQEALARATERVRRGLRFELSQLRNWQVFVNNQQFVPTANRNDIANSDEHKLAIIELVAKRIATALSEDAFAEWIMNLQRSVVAGKRERELDIMRKRIDDVAQFFRKDTGAVELSTIATLEPHDEEDSIRLPIPQNEQEVFLLYSVLSGRFRLPLRVLEYDTRIGIDAVALVTERELFDAPTAYARVEFKHQLQANRAIGHFFDAIDAFICWNVVGTGELLEACDVPETGLLRKRAKPRLASGLDAYEVETINARREKRILPVLVLERLFKSMNKKNRRS